MAKRTKNYLNNRDMLREIHLSKISFCAFKNTLEDNQQDFIVDSLNDITPEIILEAKQARAARLTRDGIVTDVEDIHDSDVVFRVMTNEHIPLIPKKKSKADLVKAAKRAAATAMFDDLIEDDDEIDLELLNEDEIELVPTRVNFPPFFHYRASTNTDNGLSFELVGKSHWKGDLESGHFSKNHGNTTNTLALMYMKLCERYGTRSNWRGYCVDSETTALTQRGWAKVNDITPDDIILSYDGENMVWSKVLSVFTDVYDGPMYKIVNSRVDTLVTPGHKLVTSEGLVKIEDILPSDIVMLMGNPLKPIKDDMFTFDVTSFMGFIPGLNEDQRSAMLSYVTDGNLECKSKAGIELLQAISALSGLPSVATPSGDNYTLAISSKKTMFINKSDIKTEQYSGVVWCPETEYGSFVARRNGKVYLTGNTYNDEMQGQALLQLTQIGLQFNEAKSQNPFAYYTAAITNSFTRVLNIEKKMQSLRDDILESNGLSPSWTRQLNNEEYIRSGDDY